MEMATSTRNARDQLRRNARQRTPIAAEFEDCIQLFYQLCSAMEADIATWEGSNVPITDLFSRFKAWGNDSRASSRSLDYTLRKASRLHEQVLELLAPFRIEIQSALQIVQQTAILFSPPIKLSENVEYFNIIPNFSDHVKTPGIISDDSKSKIDRITDDANDIFDCLSDLLPLLQDPVPEDIFDKNASPGEAQKDIELAENMFPNAAKPLITRLGHANWKRRQYQRKMRSEKSGYVQTVPKIHPLKRITMAVGPSYFPAQHPKGESSQAKSPITPAPFNLNFPAHRVILSNLSDGGLPSNSETVFSKQSRSSYFEFHSATSIDELDEPGQHRKWARFAIPKPPIPLQPGEGFLCSYCLHEILIGEDVTSIEDWTDHVFMDLEPYMCTWDDCIRADITFPTREAWFRHELDNHRVPKVWSCQSCKKEFTKSTELEGHLKEKHDSTLKPEELSLMASMCERHSQKPLVDEPCTLCGTHCSNAEVLKDHVGEHMEQLALTSISSDDGLDEDDSDSTQPTSYAQSTTMELKKERLDEFLLDVRQLAFANASNGTDIPHNISTDSDPGFLGDSDDEDAPKPAIQALEQLSTASSPERSRRPAIRRNGESHFFAKVEQFLNQQAQEDLQTIASTLATPAEEFIRDPFSFENMNQVLKQAEVPRTIRTMPPPRNDVFIGRESDLAKLYKELSVAGHTCILCGSAGLGKSATAIEYTYQFEQAYSYIFWVQAETPVGCADSYGLIASQVVLREDNGLQEQERLVMLSREFLERCDKRWLLVFDNVDDLADVQQYLPSNLLDTNGSILVTTRKMEGWTLTVPSNYARIQLEVLTLEDSRRLLLSSRNVDYKDMANHPEYKLAGEIANYAERLPLALSHIAGYIQVSGCSLHDFVELWKERHQHTTLHPPIKTIMSKTDKALEIVWNIGLREVTIDARELLNILAFLDSDTIQKDLLVGEHKEPILEILHSSEAFRYKRMTSELNRRRLVVFRTRDGEEILSIHRSLQEKILKDLEQDPRQRERVYKQAFLLVRKRFPLPSPIQVPEPEKWPACIKYLRHVLSLRKAFAGNFITIPPSVDLARLLSDGGIGLWERGMTSEGLELLRSAEGILHQISSREDLLKANIHVIIALLIQDQGIAQFSDSKDRIWQALQIRKDYQSNTPPDKYTKNDDILLHNAWSDYGCVLLQYNRYLEAEPIFAHCVRKYREWGPDETIPYEHAKYNHHMAFCQMYQKNFTEAVELAEKGLHFVTLATGQSASTNNWKFDMACVVLQSGNVERALKLHQEVLAARLEHHGKSNFLTSQSYYAVAAINSHQGDLISAELHMREALGLENSRRDLYPEAAIARTEFHLSQILKQKNKNPDWADKLLANARSTLAKLLPLNPLEGVPDKHELALFDHIQPIFDGRFTGTLLLQYVAGESGRRGSLV